MNRDELLFICGLFFGMIFQWNNTLCAFIIGMVVGNHYTPKLNMLDTENKTTSTKKKKDQVNTGGTNTGTNTGVNTDNSIITQLYSLVSSK